MDPEALPRPTAEASEDDRLEKAPQVALDAANMDGLYFHREVFFFEVNNHLVKAAIVLPYRCVEVGRKPHDALARRRKKDGLLGNVEKCSTLQIRMLWKNERVTALEIEEGTTYADAGFFPTHHRIEIIGSSLYP